MVKDRPPGGRRAAALRAVLEQPEQPCDRLAVRFRAGSFSGEKVLNEPPPLLPLSGEGGPGEGRGRMRGRAARSGQVFHPLIRRLRRHPGLRRGQALLPQGEKETRPLPRQPSPLKNPANAYRRDHYYDPKNDPLRWGVFGSVRDLASIPNSAPPMRGAALTLQET